MEDKINELRELSVNFMNNEILDNFGIKYQYNSSLQSLLLLHFQLEGIKQVKEQLDDVQIQQYIGLMGVIYGDIILEYVGEGEYIDDEEKGLILKIKDFESNIYDEIFQIISNNEINVYEHIYVILKHFKEDQKIKQLSEYQFIHIRAYSTFLMMRETYNINMDFTSGSLDAIYEYSMLLHKEFDEIPEDALNNLVEMLSGYVSVIFLMNFNSASLKFLENGEGISVIIGNTNYNISNKVYKNISAGVNDDIRGLLLLANSNI